MEIHIHRHFMFKQNTKVQATKRVTMNNSWGRLCEQSEKCRKGLSLVGRARDAFFLKLKLACWKFLNFWKCWKLISVPGVVCSERKLTRVLKLSRMDLWNCHCDSFCNQPLLRNTHHDLWMTFVSFGDVHEWWDCGKRKFKWISWKAKGMKDNLCHQLAEFLKISERLSEASF